MTGRARRVVGILGGMGPEATVWLMQRVLAMTPAQDDSDHVPLLVDSNTQVPSRIKALIEGGGEDPVPILCRMAQRLQACGAEALAIACNTAHFYASVVANHVDIPLLNVLELTAAEVVNRPFGAHPRAVHRVGLLASPAVRMTGLFNDAFNKLSIQTVYPINDQPVLDCIKAIKAGRADDQVVTALGTVITEYQRAGVDRIVVACSELSIIKDELPNSLPVIDSIDVLARSIVAFSKDTKLSTA